jgi:RNA polymerase sigma factor (sigma-70 family)
MAHRTFQAALRHIRRIAGGSAGPERPDDTLLDRFVDQRDAAAFEELVHRHGPMVMGVCRRVLGRTADAEDAFQATFLVLLRKAGTFGRRGSLAGWLYTAAHRVALRARASAARRRECERDAMKSQHFALMDDDQAWNDLRPVIDEELGRLPEKYREPVVLCYLEGNTEQEAARQLECPVGTLSWRLVHARELLRTRLTKRGVVLSTGLLSMLLAERATAAVPPATFDLTLNVAGALLATGPASTTTAGIASAQVSALTEGVLHAMFITRMKIAAGMLALILTIGSVLAFQAWAVDPADRGEAKPSAAKPTARIQPDQFSKLQEMIKPKPGGFAEVPWMTDLWAARKKAAAEGKPLLVWVGDGHPLGWT